MRMVLGISTVLGIFGVVAAFGLFYLGERVFNLDQGHVQTLMYLKLSVAGHLTIFLTRTRGRFWSIRPAKVLLLAVFGTQTVATLIAVFGIFMTPLGWGWALFVWGYALVWFLVNDRVKLLAYRIFDPTREPLLARQPRDLTPQIAARAYELYEQRVRGEGQAARDWLEAEREIRRDKPDAKADAPAEPAPDAKADAPAEPAPDAKDDAPAEPAPDAKADAPAEPAPDAKADAPAEPAPDAKADAPAEPVPDTKADAPAEPAPDAKADAPAEPAPPV